MKEELFNDEYFMKQAFVEAQKAFDKEEIPVGAVVVANNTIVARAHNLTETLNDVTAHAEMQVITAATNTIGSKYLNECTMFITLEPCVMCAGALFWAQLRKLVYGASDLKRGYTKCPIPLLHPKTKVITGIMAHESELLLQDFFRKKR
ncbi:tRNA-specific adenosine deaminase [subsurface metagenome]